VRFAGFLQFSLWFSVFVNNDGGFSDFLPYAFYGFSGFATEVTPRSRAKTGIRSRYFGVVTVVKQTMKS